jgi:hypothetical protein
VVAGLQVRGDRGHRVRPAHLRHLSQGETARIHVLDHGGGHKFLRSGHDAQSEDNLAGLGYDWRDGGTGATGSFEVVVTVGATALDRVIAALHASSVVSHRESLAAAGFQIDLTLARPRLTPLPGDGTSVAITTRVAGVVTRNDQAFDAGFSFTADLTAHVRLTVKGPDDAHAIRVALKAAPPPPANAVQLLSPLLTSQAAIVRPVLERWIRQRPAAWPITLPSELSFVTGARARVDAEGALQVGLDAGPGIDPAVYPRVEAGDWSVAISRRRISTRIYDALGAALGGLPGSGRRILLDPVEQVYLTRLGVILNEGTVTLWGNLERTTAPQLNAGFTALVPLALGATGLVEIGAVSVGVQVQEWYGAVLDFVSGGAISRALRDGIRTALTGDEGTEMLSSLMTPSLLRDLTRLGLDVDLALEARPTRLQVRPTGIAIGGDLAVTVQGGPEVALRALVDPARRRVLLWAIDSWVAAGTPVEARWTFGDGEVLQTSGPGLRFVVEHTYAAGQYTPSLTLVDDRGRSTTAQASVVIP